VCIGAKPRDSELFPEEPAFHALLTAFCAENGLAGWSRTGDRRAARTSVTPEIIEYRAKASIRLNDEMEFPAATA